MTNSNIKIRLLIASDFCTHYIPGINPGWGRNLNSLKEHDFSILNLEGPLTYSNTPILKKGPALKMLDLVLSPYLIIILWTWVKRDLLIHSKIVRKQNY